MPSPTSRLKTATLEKRIPNCPKDAVSALIDMPDLQAAAFGLAYCTRNHAERETFFHLITSFTESLGNPARGTHLLRHFERTLADMNESLALLQKSGGLPFTSCSGLLGIVLQNQLFLAQFGELSLLFLHKTDDRRFSVYELVDDDLHDDGWRKSFVTIFDGEFHDGDVFFGSTPSGQEGVSSDDLRSIITTLPPQSALERLVQFWPPLNPFAGIVLAFEQTKVSALQARENPVTSVNTLLESKKRTETYLEERSAGGPSSAITFLQRVSYQLRHPGVRGPAETVRRSFGLFVSSLVGTYRRVLTFIKKTRTPKKTLILGGVLAVGLLVFAVMHLRTSQASQQQHDVFDKTVSRIEEQVVAAEAGLIYGNAKAAQQNIDDAVTGLSTLVIADGSEQTKVDAVRERIQKLNDRLQGITPVNSQLLTKKAATDSQPIASVLRQGHTLFVVTRGKTLYQYADSDTSSADLAPIAVTLDPFGSVAKALPLSDGTVLLMDASGQLGKVDLQAKTFALLSSGLSTLLPDDIALYNDVIYALRSSTEQITKFAPVDGGYAATGTPWVVAKTSPLTSAKSLSIDGKVYVATLDGVLEFLSGKQQDWQTSPISPPMSSPNAMWTDTASDNLYILDAPTSRIIAIDKTSGKIVAQYKDANLLKAHSFVVEEDQKRVVFATDDALYTFAIAGK